MRRFEWQRTKSLREHGVNRAMKRLFISFKNLRYLLSCRAEMKRSSTRWLIMFI